ncbi:hypothetical protein F511_26536 [Dorcoceras hygrometricum]|uniref:Uncharacterized protein n=1 Tax=Dorcoceras hygrometricum TaxID=472368 RepID=A0A2Z7CUE3_9LAMI|nr:hypothetical protein F511_26536 [Dorcoceras hygrometricum]
MRLLRQPALEGLTRSARTDSPHRIGRKQFSGEEEAAAAAARGGGGGGAFREERRRFALLGIGYPRMSASGESSTTMHRLLHASGSHPILTPYDPKPKNLKFQNRSKPGPISHTGPKTSRAARDRPEPNPRRIQTSRHDIAGNSPEHRRSGGRPAAAIDEIARAARGARGRDKRGSPSTTCANRARSRTLQHRPWRAADERSGAAQRWATRTREAATSDRLRRRKAARFQRRNRQSGPRPETRLLRQPALEGLTRSARTDSPRRMDRKQFSGEEEAAAAAARGGGGGGAFREERRRFALLGKSNFPKSSSRRAAHGGGVFEVEEAAAFA